MEAGSRVAKAKAIAQGIVDKDPKKWSRIGFIKVELPQRVELDDLKLDDDGKDLMYLTDIEAYQFNVRKLFRRGVFVGAAVFE